MFGANEAMASMLEDFNAKCASALGRGVATADRCRGKSCADCSGSRSRGSII
jgi:hypothetical protein